MQGTGGPGWRMPMGCEVHEVHGVAFVELQVCLRCAPPRGRMQLAASRPVCVPTSCRVLPLPCLCAVELLVVAGATATRWTICAARRGARCTPCAESARSSAIPRIRDPVFWGLPTNFGHLRRGQHMAPGAFCAVHVAAPCLALQAALPGASGRPALVAVQHSPARHEEASKAVQQAAGDTVDSALAQRANGLVEALNGAIEIQHMRLVCPLRAADSVR